MSKPEINVTPLIDVLLVLLIIFMVVTPIKPNKFEAKIPQEPKNDTVIPDPQTLVVTISPDTSLSLNKIELGSVENPQKIIEMLADTFRLRSENGVFITGSNDIQRTVFIKAPREISYGNVAKVVDAVKSAGAKPISLQIDSLD